MTHTFHVSEIIDTIDKLQVQALGIVFLPMSMSLVSLGHLLLDLRNIKTRAVPVIFVSLH